MKIKLFKNDRKHKAKRQAIECGLQTDTLFRYISRVFQKYFSCRLTSKGLSPSCRKNRGCLLLADVIE